MSEYGWMTSSSSRSKESKQLHVSSSSVLGLKAAVAATKRSTTTTKQDGINHVNSSSTRITRKVKQDPKNKSVRGIEERKTKDETAHLAEKQRSKKTNIFSKLEKKADMYDRLSQLETNNDDGRNEYLVDFSRKGGEKMVMGEYDSMVEILDEFGRVRKVKENSTEYRCYIAQESWKRKQRDMESVPGFAIPVSNQSLNTTPYYSNIYEEVDVISSDQAPPPSLSIAAVASSRCGENELRLKVDNYNYRPLNDMEKDHLQSIEDEVIVPKKSANKIPVPRKYKKEERLALIRKRTKN